MKPTFKQLIYPVCRNAIYQILISFIILIPVFMIMTSCPIFLDNDTAITIINFIIAMIIIVISVKYSLKQVFFKPYKRIVVTPKFKMKLEKEHEDCVMKTVSKYYLPSNIVREYIIFVSPCIILYALYQFITDMLTFSQNIIIDIIYTIILYVTQYFVLKRIICKYADIDIKNSINNTNINNYDNVNNSDNK